MHFFFFFDLKYAYLKTINAFFKQTRGAKYTLRWFSHEVADLEPVLALLLQQNIHDCAVSDYSIFSLM